MLVLAGRQPFRAADALAAQRFQDAGLAQRPRHEAEAGRRAGQADGPGNARFPLQKGVNRLVAVGQDGAGHAAVGVAADDDGRQVEEVAGLGEALAAQEGAVARVDFHEGAGAGRRGGPPEQRDQAQSRPAVRRIGVEVDAIDGALSLRGFPEPQQSLRGREHLGGQQLFHAAMVQRADAALARAAVHLLLQMDGPREVRFGPGDVRRAEQRHHRPVERGGEVARAAVGGDQQVGPADARLGQAQRQRRPVGRTGVA